MTSAFTELWKCDFFSPFLGYTGGVGGMLVSCSSTSREMGNKPESLRLPWMNGEQIERTDSAKILGVTISADLTWNAHVNNTVSKASKRLYMLYQLKRAGVDQRDLVRIYMSVIRPVLEYAAPVWSTSMSGYVGQNWNNSKASHENDLPRNGLRRHSCVS